MLDMGQRNLLRAMVGGSSDAAAARLGMMAECILALNSSARGRYDAIQKMEERLGALAKEVDVQVEGEGGLKSRFQEVEDRLEDLEFGPDRVAKLEKAIHSIRDLDTVNLSLLEKRVRRLEGMADAGVGTVERIGPPSLRDVGWLEVYDGDDVTFWCEWGAKGRYRVLLVPIPEGQDPGPDGPAEEAPWPSVEARERIAAGVSLSRVLRESVEWAEETFGPGYDPHAKAAHLLKEAKELRDDPTDPEEMADVLMILGHLAAGAGVDLAAEVRKKLEKNRQREWGEPDGDGVVEHVRERDDVPFPGSARDRIRVHKLLADRALEMSEGLGIVARERLRQVSEEGFDASHDDEHTDGALAAAGASYAMAHSVLVKTEGKAGGTVPGPWPFDLEWWKPSPDPVRNLAKAAALIVAELDRILRQGADRKPAADLLAAQAAMKVGPERVEGADTGKDYLPGTEPVEMEETTRVEGWVSPKDVGGSPIVFFRKRDSVHSARAVLVVQAVGPEPKG